MLLTISTTYRPATDLGYLLHKHPARLQTFQLSFGQAHVFYPEATLDRCTAALLLDIDPIQIFRSRRGSGNSSFALQQYVNDRPYVGSSLLSVAIADVFGTAMGGRCKDRPELVNTNLPLQARISVLPSRGGAGLLRRLFEPLGYQLDFQSYPLDAQFPDWGTSDVFTVEFNAVARLKDLLTHLYVLIPVLDDDKHYYVSEDEIAKLMARGEGWLSTHPERELIVERYLRHRRDLTLSALNLLREEEGSQDRATEEQADLKEEAIEKSIGLHQQRLEFVYTELKDSGAHRVVDLGCGEGKLMRLLLPDGQFKEVVGMDVSARSLANAEYRLQLNHLPDAQQKKLKLIQGSLLYRDRRLEGYDAVTLVEVIEHMQPSRLEVMEWVVFDKMRPATVILTTPNQEYNRMWASLPAGEFRHPDHRFEWTRAELRAWAERVAQTYGYAVTLKPIGPNDPEVGSPTQMAVFTYTGIIPEGDTQ